MAVRGINEIRKNIAYIFSARNQGERIAISPLGTGFSVLVPHAQTEGQAWIYFVTAKHVLKRNRTEYHPTVFSRANLRSWDPGSGQAGVTFIRFDVLGTEGNLLWDIHSNPAVDIAIKQEFPNPKVF